MLNLSLLNAQTIHTEQELIQMLKDGNEAAFEKIYQLYSSRLLYNLIKIVKSEETATELLQETFIRVWNHRYSIDPEKCIRSYLFRIAENLAYDFFRKAAKDQKLQAELIRLAAMAYTHVEEGVFVKENVKIMEDVIKTLPLQRQQVFRLIKLEGKSYAEVSQMLSISTSTISDHIVKATKFIKEQLTRDFHLGGPLLISFLLSY